MMTLNNIAKSKLLSKLFVRTLTVSLLAGACLSEVRAQTDTKWAGGTGSGREWDVEENWTKALPDGTTYRALFDTSGTVEIDVSAGSATQGMQVSGAAGGSNVILNIAASLSGEAALTITGSLGVGASANGPAHLTLTGGGTVAMQQFLVGSNKASIGGNTLRISGGTTVLSGATALSRVGRFGDGNRLIVDEGSSLTFGSLTLGYAENGAGTKNNGFTITGAGSQVTMTVMGTNRGLRIGSNGDGAGSYETAQSGNFVAVQDGASLVLSGSNNVITVGSANFSHSNSLLVEGRDETGAGSLLHLDGLAGDALTIGDAAEINNGGNFVEVRSGGKLVSTGSGALAVYGHAASANSADNRLTIGPDGSVDLGGGVTISNALLELDAAGELKAGSVTIKEGARFHAAGSGLSTTGIGATRIEAGGALAIRGQGQSEAAAEILTLSSTVSLEKEAVLELMIFANHTISQIELVEGGELIIDPEATLRIFLDGDYAPSSGDSWVLFLGLTEAVSGGFDPQAMELPTLEGALEWDLSRFNQEGNWTVAVIPEPSTALLLVFAGGVLLFRMRQPSRAGEEA